MPAADKTVRLTHPGLPATDLARSIAFYEKCCGMKVERPADQVGARGARFAQTVGVVD